MSTAPSDTAPTSGYVRVPLSGPVRQCAPDVQSAREPNLDDVASIVATGVPIQADKLGQVLTSTTNLVGNLPHLGVKPSTSLGLLTDM